MEFGQERGLPVWTDHRSRRATCRRRGSWLRALKKHLLGIIMHKSIRKIIII